MKSIIDQVDRPFEVGGLYTIADLPAGSVVVWSVGSSYEQALFACTYPWIIGFKADNKKIAIGVYENQMLTGWADYDSPVYYVRDTIITEEMKSRCRDYSIYC